MKYKQHSCEGARKNSENVLTTTQWKRRHISEEKLNFIEKLLLEWGAAVRGLLPFLLLSWVDIVDIVDSV